MPNIEIGDKVRFLNEVGEGIVTKIQNNTTYVLIDEGFEVPMNTNQLIIVEKHTKQEFLNKEENYYSTETEEREFDEDEVFALTNEQSEPLTNDIYLAFVHEKDLKDDELNLYLINDSENNFTFCLFNHKMNSSEFIDTAHLESGTKLLIKHLTKQEIAQISSYTIQGVLYNPENKKIGKLFNKTIKVNSLYLFNSDYFRENDFFDEPAFLISVIQAEKNLENLKLQKIKDDNEELKNAPKLVNKKSELVEYDLHISELVDDYKNLTPTEMLNIQLNHFRKKLEEYIITPHIKKVVFIHGVGNGTLKLEIRKILANEYSHYDYQDASYKDYGFGATMVILRK